MNQQSPSKMGLYSGKAALKISEIPRKKFCDEVLFGKSDISRAVLKMKIFPETPRIANTNKTCEELDLLQKKLLMQGNAYFMLIRQIRGNRNK